MRFHRSLSLFALLAVLIGACADRSSSGTNQASSATPPPKWMTEEPTTTVEPSPEVKALLKEDPDIRDLSEAEIKAALAAAQSSAPPPPSSGPRVAPTGEWSKLESEQKSQLDAHRKRLEGTIVERGRDGAYHSGGCPTLYSEVFDERTRTVRRVKTSTPVTLANAANQGLTRHAECAAPSHEFVYGK